MAKTIITEPSRTLSEYRLLPSLTTPESSIGAISLDTTLTRQNGTRPGVALKTPLLSAAMQSVSGVRMAIELARLGGVGVLFASQTPEDQAKMVKAVKGYRAGFVNPKTVAAETLLSKVTELERELGYSTFPVVGADQTFLGLITRNDYDPIRHAALPVKVRMREASTLTVGVGIVDLERAHERLIESHQSVLPIVDDKGRLLSMVFRKDIFDHLESPKQVLDEKGRLLCFAALNTHDYKERLPLLVAEGVDGVVIDSSDGHSSFQRDALLAIKKDHPNLPVIGGNVITKEGFLYLAEAGADAIKVGMGGGSICITQEQKGTGRGLATAVLDVVQARDEYFAKTKVYIPVIADGGIETGRDVTIALAIGADACMMGRYFARMEESPTEKVVVNNRVMKPYWGEGAARARSWRAQRYGQATFVEGVEGLVEYAGKLKDNLDETLAKVAASMSSCGSPSLPVFRKTAVLELISQLSIREGQVHDIVMPSTDGSYGERSWGQS